MPLDLETRKDRLCLVDGVIRFGKNLPERLIQAALASVSVMRVRRDISCGKGGRRNVLVLGADARVALPEVVVLFQHEAVSRLGAAEPGLVTVTVLIVVGVILDDIKFLRGCETARRQGDPATHSRRGDDDSIIVIDLRPRRVVMA